ncbi:MAG: protein-glutamate O-methyltransferase CheR [Thermoanaerobaculia bacterium]|nr:protein-glutamate O-methyltransferase CheR [Thermoanaerobaculia bacterium]
MNHSLDLPDDVFRKIRDAIYNRCGIYFSDNNKYLLQKRLSARAKELNFDSFQKYFYFLEYDRSADKEFEQIFDLVTTNETYFFREPAQLSAFSEEIVPELLDLYGTRKIRIWSAGCSSGEEPYTIAILLDQKGYFGRGTFEIFGSDISQSVLSRARSGTYRESSFRATDADVRDEYFNRQENNTWKINDAIRNRVSFGKLNLYESVRVAMLGTVDVIFCRNVIIYFDDDSKKRVVSNFHDRLRDGGYLLLGHSESLISLSTKFKLKHLEHDMVYQK